MITTVVGQWRQQRIPTLENVAIANALQLEATWEMPALYRFNYDTMPSLTSLNLYIAVLYSFCFWCIMLHCDLDFWPRDPAKI